MLNRRLQVLLDEPRHRKLEAEARRRGVSVATIVREALDQVLPVTAETRQEAARTVLDAARMPVPEDPAGLREELEELRGRRG